MTDDRFHDPRVDRDLASREATVTQRLGADPRRHVVLRASAGSGKTKVLIDRIVRLLVDGAPLKSLAAMTFTKKAAVEIRDRLLRAVRAMALDDDDALRDRLRKLLGADPADHHLARARGLFEEVLEDPSGVHIGTIHTFCQSLLSRFADLAGVDPNFAIIERTDELRDEALDRLERECAADPDTRAAFARLASSPAAARDVLGEWLHRRLELDRWCDAVAARTGTAHATRMDLLPDLERDLAGAVLSGTVLEHADNPGPEDLRTPALEAIDLYIDQGIPAVRRAQEPHDTPAFHAYLDARADELRGIATALQHGRDPLAALKAVRAAVFTTDGEGWKPKAGNAGGDKNKEERLEAYAVAAGLVVGVIVLGDLMDLLEANRRRLRFGLRLLDIYDSLKRRDRVLDFHDLERMAWSLVRDEELGPWVLYRMDERLDHLLVDEFQDTNRNQWDILEPFVDEFMAARDDRDRPRTVFLVGDVKQSIYRFRGACPELFGQAADSMSAAAGQDVSLTLPTNFRSLPEVVLTVGERFQATPLRNHLPDPREVDAAAQLPFRDDAPGLVIFRPVVEREDDVDVHEACARRAAAQIRDIVTTRETLDEDTGGRRPAAYRDVLVLCRARTNLGAVEDALRREGIPYEPAGRGALGAAREVHDIADLLRWLVFDSDDAALASVLRSPLVRLSEDELQGLLAATRRRGDLWKHLSDLPEDHSLAPTASLLAGWLKRAGLDGAHDLLRRIYREADAPARYAAALGEQARQNLLRLHDLALAHDAAPHASLRGFLRELDRAADSKNHEEGALPEADGGRVRVMTIHKSKGLEAPYVLLVDAAAPFREDPSTVQVGGDQGPVVEGVKKEHRRPPGGQVETAVSTAATLSVRDARREEANLLYVAMTRARDELHVLAVEPSRGRFKPSHARWLEDAGQPMTPWDEPTVDGAASATTTAPVTDDPKPWTPIDTGPRLRVVSPSALGDTPLPGPDPTPDHDTAPADTPDPAERGTRIHLWLQRAAEAGAVPPGAGPEWEEARAVFENPAHASIFHPADDVTALCEAPLIHRLPGDGVETRVQGFIDRLLIAPDRVTIVDYKSNRPGPGGVDALVEHYRPQMDAYRKALAAVHPDRSVEAVLLFTHVVGNEGPGLAIKV